MISANDRFLGCTPESVVAAAGLFTKGLDSCGLLVVADDEVGRLSFSVVERGFFTAGAGPAGDDCSADAGLSLCVATHLSAGCGEGLGELSVDRGRLDSGSVRAALTGTLWICSEALRFNATSLGRDRVVGDGEAD